jgi:hypothetical protein
MRPSRIAFWRKAFLRPLMLVAIASPVSLWALMSGFVLIRDEFAQPKNPEKWKLIVLFRELPWWAWVIATLVLMMLVLLEGVYRYAHPNAESEGGETTVTPAARKGMLKLTAGSRDPRDAFRKAHLEQLEDRRLNALAEAAEEELKLKRLELARIVPLHLLSAASAAAITVRVRPFATGWPTVKGRYLTIGIIWHPTNVASKAYAYDIAKALRDADVAVADRYMREMTLDEAQQLLGVWIIKSEYWEDKPPIVETLRQVFEEEGVTARIKWGVLDTHIQIAVGEL